MSGRSGADGSRGAQRREVPGAFRQFRFLDVPFPREAGVALGTDDAQLLRLRRRLRRGHGRFQGEVGLANSAQGAEVCGGGASSGVDAAQRRLEVERPLMVDGWANGRKSVDGVGVMG